jgi:hypothetical protein
LTHLRHTRLLLLVESTILLVVVFFISYALILPKSTFHFPQVIISFYNSGSIDFSADVTALVRGLGAVSLMTLVVGFTVGAAMALTHTEATKTKQDLDNYESAVVNAGFVKIMSNSNGTTYELTPAGRRFLREYEFLKLSLQDQSEQLTADQAA